MKRTMALTMVCALLFAACDMGDGTAGKTPLDTPANVRVDAADFTLRWSAVSGATAYAVDIDGAMETTAATEFPLERLASDSKVYTLRVRALAGSGNVLYDDSAYSDPLDCEPAVYIFTYESGTTAQPNVRLARNIAQFDQAAGDGLTITGLTPYGRTLELINIPIKVGLVQVIKIGISAFAGNTTVATVIIPETITQVGDNAFNGCSALIEVTFNRSADEGITALGEGVFEGCAALESITVPEGSGDAYAESITEVSPGIADKVQEPARGYYTVTFDPAGGLFSGSAVGDNTNILTVQVEAGQRVSPPSSNPVRQGYAFSGWYGTNGRFDFDAPINENLTLYAVWQNDTGATKTLNSIAVVQPPKTNYTAGEKFDPAGMTVSAAYSDGSAAAVGHLIEVFLQGGTATSELEPNNRPLTVNDRVVVISYIENPTSNTPTLYVAADEAVTTATGIPRLVVQANSIADGTKYGVANITVTATGGNPGDGTGGTGSTQP